MNAGNADGTNPKGPRPPRAARTVFFGSLGADEAGKQDRRAFLTVIRGRGDLGQHALIDAPLVLGRDPDCRFRLQDLGVSWQHAKITPHGMGTYVIEDLHSTNGTRVEGAPITGLRILRDGDKIFLGETVVRFTLADSLDVDFQSEIAMLVGTDPLTGLESKRRFDEALDFSLRAAQDTGGSLAVLMMDMDGVKKINDTHGHLFGAHVIGETGRIIARHLGAEGHACRFGGDEFSAFLPGCGLEEARDVAEAIRGAVEGAGMQKEGIDLRPTISIGLACHPESGTQVLDLVHAADEALYRAKAAGKNCVCA